MPASLRVLELLRLTEEDIRGLGDPQAVLQEIDLELASHKGKLEGQKSVVKDLRQTDSARAFAFGGFFFGVAGLVLMAAAPPAGALFWLGGVATAGGAGTGWYGLDAMHRNDRKSRDWDRTNAELAATIDGLEASRKRVKDMWNLP